MPRLEFIARSSIAFRRRPIAIRIGMARSGIARAILRLITRFVAWLVLGIIAGRIVEIGRRN